MTVEQRRELLRGELSSLVEAVSNYHSTCPNPEIDNPFIAELEAQMQRKTAELEALNAQALSPISRFRASCRDFLFLIWIVAVLTCTFAPFFWLFLPTWMGGLFVATAILSLIWAIWVSTAPRES